MECWNALLTIILDVFIYGHAAIMLHRFLFLLKFHGGWNNKQKELCA
jgi:hypothetical protein